MAVAGSAGGLGNFLRFPALAAQYGGGGHFNAAGCTMPYGLARAREEIIRVLTHARKRDTDRQD